MGEKLVHSPQWLEHADQFSVFDHFFNYATGGLWTSVVTDSGTIATSTGVGGIVTLTPSDGTVADNDEAYLYNTTNVFKFGTSQMVFQARGKFTEANTSAANIAVGWANAVAANLIVDDGAGMKTSGSMAAIYKVDGGLVWKFVTSVGSSQTISTSVQSSVNTGYQRFRIEYHAQDSTTGFLVPYVDGIQLTDSNGLPIRHNLTYTSAVEMQAFAAIKNGSANLETFLVDYIGAVAVNQ